MLRIFAGANVFIAVADSRSGAVLLPAEAGLLRLVVSRQVLDEAERNLRKKRHARSRPLPRFWLQSG